MSQTSESQMIFFLLIRKLQKVVLHQNEDVNQERERHGYREQEIQQSTWVKAMSRLLCTRHGERFLQEIEFEMHSNYLRNNLHNWGKS